MPFLVEQRDSHPVVVGGNLGQDGYQLFRYNFPSLERENDRNTTEDSAMIL